MIEINRLKLIYSKMKPCTRIKLTKSYQKAYNLIMPLSVSIVQSDRVFQQNPVGVGIKGNLVGSVVYNFL